MTHLAGKTALGAASRGMGRASALALAGAGAQVFAGTLDLPQRNSVTHKGT
jgi:NAD(P)-dependent dehydrogenase (short-subunit alcohol dehydrogenase family)